MTFQHRQPQRPRSVRRYTGSMALSLLVHVLVALCLAVLIVRQQAPELWTAAGDVAVVLIEWSKPVLTTHERPVPASPAETPPSQDDTAEESTPLASKPTVGSGRSVRAAPGPATSRPMRTLEFERPRLDELDPSADLHRKAPRKGLTRLGRRRVDSPRLPLTEAVVYVGTDEVVPVELPYGQLRGESPAVGRGSGFFYAGRGLGAGNAPGGAGYGGSNGSPISGTSNSVFRTLMRRLAKGITEYSTREKVDVVFVLDTTASMEDNVRGVRAYVDDFVDLLTYEHRKPKFGLVTFSDVVREPPKVRGLTSKSMDLRKWLHRTEFSGGGDLAESGLDAVMAAVERLDFRRDAHKRIIFVSDGPFHDRDHDGQSRYTLDEVIATLNAKDIHVDSVSLEHLPMQQLAWGTGGRWIRIPGKGYLEQVALPVPVRSNAALGVLSTRDGRTRDELYVFADPARPSEWVELRWRILGPRGDRIQGEFVERVAFSGSRVTFRPAFDPLWFWKSPGYYTVIYRVTDSNGGSSVLRRVIDYR